jgi:hypothetical protein
MPKAIKNAPSTGPWDSEVRLLAWLATCVSVISFLAYFQRGDVALYGDAIAHMNIARRVFDSKTPGLLQLGTVWLPLPHLLMIPFLLSNDLWRRGAGGSIPSMVAYVFAVIGIFRLMRSALSRTAVPDAPARIAAWTAAVVFAANPNLIYMQTTAMGEALYLAFFVWALVHLGEYVRGNSNALTKCGLCLAAGCLTRYDGWFLAVAIAATIVLLTLFSRNAPASKGSALPVPRATAVRFVLIAAAAPALWLAYNAIVYRNPLEFANGPYSAREIERKTQGPGQGHPGSGNPLLAGMYFVKSAEANVAANEWLGRAWLLFVLMGTIAAVQTYRARADARPFPPGAWLPLLFLLVPIPFYALSVAYSGVPIFIPAWWPFSRYNVRYGLQLLPAFAAALSVIVYLAARSERWKPRLRLACALAVLALVIVSYASIWRTVPISLEEPQVNMRFRLQLEAQLGTWLEKLPSNSTFLMYLGEHPGAVQHAGISLDHVINEGNHRTWRQPSDPNGLWERALADPAHYTDYVVAFEGDPVWQAIEGRHLPALVEIHTTGQQRAILYRAR